MIKKEDNKLIIEGKLQIDERFSEDMDGWHWVYYLEEQDSPNEVDYEGAIHSLLEDQSYSETNSRPRIRITVEVLAD